LAVTTGTPRRSAALVGAADQFDEDVDRRGRRERDRLGEEGNPAEIDAAIARRPRADCGDGDLASGPTLQRLPLPAQQRDQRRADDAEARDSDTQWFRHDRHRPAHSCQVSPSA
jgi:hypothetical protein